MQYEVKTLYGLQKKISAIGVAVPGSKSLTARALMVAALKDGITEILNILPGAETDSLLDALYQLGFETDFEDEGMTVIVYGRGGDIPKRDAHVDLGVSLAAARSIPSILAFAGGEYFIDAAESIRKRSFKVLFDALAAKGVKIVYHDKEGTFPVTLISDGIAEGVIELPPEGSSYLSGLMIAQMISPDVEIEFNGSRRKLPIEEIGEDSFDEDELSEDEEEHEVYFVEPDMAFANYYFAMALILGISVQVADTHTDSVQSDIEFLRILKRLGCMISDEDEGIRVTGPKDGIYRGLQVDLGSMPEQTFTMIAIAAFAKATTHITGIARYIKQEEERLKMVCIELEKIGVKAKITEAGIIIRPGKLQGALINTGSDVRVAMLFALIGLRREGIVIDNAECVKRHFGEFFATVDRIRQLLTQ